MEILYWIDVGYACFGVVSLNNKIIDAAPIAKWSIGKNTYEVLKYYKTKKKAKIIKMHL